MTQSCRGWLRGKKSLVRRISGRPHFLKGCASILAWGASRRTAAASSIDCWLGVPAAELVGDAASPLEPRECRATVLSFLNNIIVRFARTPIDNTVEGQLRRVHESVLAKSSPMLRSWHFPLFPQYKIP